MRTAVYCTMTSTVELFLVSVLWCMNSVTEQTSHICQMNWLTKQQIFFKIALHSGAMNSFDSAIDNDILSVHYQIGRGDFAKTSGGSALILSAN